MPYRKNSVIKPPWGGWNDSAPSALLGANSFRQITNNIIRFNRLQPDFLKAPWAQGAGYPAEGKVLMGGGSYVDQQGFWHTILVDNKGYGEVIPGSPYTVSNVFWDPSFPSYPDSALFSNDIFNNQFFFCNGFLPLQFHQGDGHVYPASSNLASNVGSVGDFPGSCYFLGSLASRLLALNTVEGLKGTVGSQNFPSRVRYSAVNNGAEWDFTVDASAGVFDIADIEDQITGFTVINQTGFIFRNGGISAMSQTGSQTIPFFIENFSLGPRGVGCYLPFTLDTYGTVACFVAQDDVYTFSGGAPSPIGTNAKKSIFKDLSTRSSTAFGTMFGTLGGFIDYLTYWLAIPQNSDQQTSVWVYHFDDQSWTNFQYPYGALRVLELVMVN